MDSATLERIAIGATTRAPQFPLVKFRPPALPAALVKRSGLSNRLAAGAGRRLTVVVGSAGSGKTVLLADWVASRPPGLTSWMSCDGADDDPVRFWAGLIEALRAVEPGFGSHAVDLLEMDGRISADVVASTVNAAAKLPAGSAVVVDNFHIAASAVASAMTDLVECWPAKTVQLVLASRFAPPLRTHRMRMSGELCEIRDRDLYFSLDESRDLLTKAGLRLPEADLALLHQRSEGWPAALQMLAAPLSGVGGLSRASDALEARGHAIDDYFVDEVLDRQPPEIARFMLDTSVLDELTVPACTAATARQDAAALLRAVDAAGLFLVTLDAQRTRFRYHHLVRQALHSELRARDPARERLLHLRMAEWFEGAGDARHAARHFMSARYLHRALVLLRDQGVASFLRDPVSPAPLDLSAVRPELIAEAPDELLALATDLLMSGDIARGGQYLDLFDRMRTSPRLEPALAARLAVMRAFRYAAIGQLDKALGAIMRAQVIREQVRLGDEWAGGVPLILMRICPSLEILDAVEREAAAALAMPGLPKPVGLVLVPGARALALAESGHLSEAAAAAEAAEANARQLGFEQHVFASDYLRAMAGLALERSDLDTAESLTEHALSISEGRWPLSEFLALLDRARIWAVRGRIWEALGTVESARMVLGAPCSALRARADEQEAVLRLSLGDLNSAADLASGLRPPARRDLLLARIALAAGDHRAARDRLEVATLGNLTPRRALEREVLLAAAAIERSDPMAGSVLGTAVHMARRQGFLGTVVTTAPQVTAYLVEYAVQLRTDPFVERMVAAALDVRAAQSAASPRGRVLAEPLTAAEERVLQHLPTSSYAQIADTLYVSRNTVKTHLRSIYRKFGVASRSQAVERALDLHLL
jgi:LuxR family transcriptional regulator, maltose regulon positive regulatory protein